MHGNVLSLGRLLQDVALPMLMTAAQELLAQRKGAQHFDDAAARAAVQEADANNAVELYGLQRVFRQGRYVLHPRN